MRACLSTRRTINLKTGEILEDKKQWVELTKEQIQAFCMLVYLGSRSNEETRGGKIIENTN